MADDTAQDVDEIRRDLEDTLADMGRTVDEIADRVSPANAVAREREALRERVDAVTQKTADRARSQLAQAKAAASRVPTMPVAAGVAGAVAITSGTAAARRRRRRIEEARQAEAAGGWMAAVATAALTLLGSAVIRRRRRRTRL